MKGIDELHTDPAEEAEYIEVLIEKVRTGQIRTTADVLLNPTGPAPQTRIAVYYLKKLTADPRIQVEEGDVEKPLRLKYVESEKRYLVKIFSSALAMEEYLNSATNYEPISIADTNAYLTVLMRLLPDDVRWKRV